MSDIRKYILSDHDSIQSMNPVSCLPVNLRRVIAVKTFETRDGTMVKAGTVGGYVESESNLDQTDASWISGTSRVFSGAVITGDSVIENEALVIGRVTISNSRIGEFALVLVLDGNKFHSILDMTNMCGHAAVKLRGWNSLGAVTMFGSAVVEVFGGKLNKVHLSGGSRISGTVKVENTELRDYSEIKNCNVRDAKLHKRFVALKDIIGGEHTFEHDLNVEYGDLHLRNENAV
jgi:hypothetical protein